MCQKKRRKTGRWRASGRAEEEEEEDPEAAASPPDIKRSPADPVSPPGRFTYSALSRCERTSGYSRSFNLPLKQLCVLTKATLLWSRDGRPYPSWRRQRGCKSVVSKRCEEAQRLSVFIFRPEPAACCCIAPKGNIFLKAPRIEGGTECFFYWQ